MIRGTRRLVATGVVFAVMAVALLVGWGYLRGRPQDLPWTPLDMGQPIGMFTGRKLAALGGDFPACRRLLDAAGVRYTALPPRRAGAQCGYDDAVRLRSGAARSIALSPANLGMACPVAAALTLWEWNVVQPAAQRHFGASVTSVEHFGSYSCRRLYGRDAGAWSEHASANAVDIAGFRLSNGTRITLARDWQDDAAKAAFLREIRDGACALFATVLSPDYNAAHHDHFHLDQADRGTMGWRACR